MYFRPRKVDLGASGASGLKCGGESWHFDYLHSSPNDCVNFSCYCWYLTNEPINLTAICRFAEPVTLTSIFPYLVRLPSYSITHKTNTSQPEMIESFGIDKKNVAKWAGLTSAVFSLSQCLTAVLWGRASDKFGRKPTIMVGLTCTMICTLIWGMSTTLPMAIVARALSGACNGNGNSSLTLNSEKNVLT